jgi:hypothetical protein
VKGPPNQALEPTAYSVRSAPAFGGGSPRALGVTDRGAIVKRTLILVCAAFSILGSTLSYPRGESDAEQGRIFAQAAKDSLYLRNGGDLRNPQRIFDVGYFEGFVAGRVPPTIGEDQQSQVPLFCMPRDLTQYAGPIASYIAENPQIHSDHPTTQVLKALTALWGCKR